MASRKPAAKPAPVQPVVARQPRATAKKSQRKHPAPAPADHALAQAAPAVAALPAVETPSLNQPAPPRKKSRPAEHPPAVADISPQATRSGRAKPRPKKGAPLASAAPVTEAPTPPTTAPSVRPAAPQGPRLFQTYQEAWQRDLLDPHTTPLDQSRQPADLPELTLPLALLNHTATAAAPYWGVVSWRLVQQTGLTGLDLQTAIERHTHADIYHANAGCADEGLFHNAWLEAETQHPGLIALATALLRSCDLPTDALHSIHSANTYSNTTVLVANRAFWSRYVPFVQNIVTHAKALDNEQRAQLMSRVTDESALLGNQSSLLGVIVRRLLPVFLQTEGSGFKVHKLPLPEKERGLNVHQQLLREMKQVAHSSHSTWLAACWVNYRNLYLNQNRGKAWCQQHLRAITPSDIQFT